MQMQKAFTRFWGSSYKSLFQGLNVGGTFSLEPSKLRIEFKGLRNRREDIAFLLITRLLHREQIIKVFK